MMTYDNLEAVAALASNIKTLHIAGIEGLDLSILMRFKKLEELHITNCNLQDFAAKKGAFKQLKVLNLSHNKIVNFPKFLLGLQNLERLYISDNPLCEMCIEIYMLPNFWHLEAERTKVNWAKFIYTLPSMRIGFTPVRNHRLIIDGKGKEEDFSWDITPSNSVALFVILPKRSIYFSEASLHLYDELPYGSTQAERWEIMQFYWSKHRRQDSISRHNILNLAHTQYNIDAVLACQQWLANQAKPLEVGQHVALLGDVEDDEANIMHRCETLGLVPSRKIVAETEVVVIGRNLDIEDIETIQSREFLPIVGTWALRDFINKHHTFHYANQTNEERQALRRLIYSRDHDSAKLGFTMLMEGGVSKPEYMLTDAWYLMHSRHSRDAEICALIKNLLNHFAPPHWPKVKYPRNYKTTQAEWVSILKYGEWMDMEYLADTFENENIRCIRVLLKNMPSRKAKDFLRNYVMWYKYIFLEDLPAPSWLQYGTNYIQSLYLDDCKCPKKVPRVIFKLLNIKNLGLRNCGLDHLPRKVSRFTDLVHLDISHNPMKEFPQILNDPNFLPNLQSVYISDSIFVEKALKKMYAGYKNNRIRPELKIEGMDENIWEMNGYGTIKKRKTATNKNSELNHEDTQ